MRQGVGNITLFEELYDKYSSALISFSLSFIHNRTMAEDIVQESFMALWQQKSTLPDDTNLRNYIFTIVRNKSISLLRDKIKQRTSSIENLTASDYFLSRKLMSLEQMESSTIDIDTIERQIDKVYNELPEIYQEVFSLSRFENKSNAEIAEILDISVKAVEKRMTKTLKLFKNNLKHNFVFLSIL